MTRKEITNALLLSMQFGGYENLYKTFQSLKNSVKNEDWDFLLDTYQEIYEY